MGCRDVAKAALHCLHALLMEQHDKQEAREDNVDDTADGQASSNTPEAFVLRILIRMAVEDVDAAISLVTTAASKDQPAETTSSKVDLAAAFAELGRHLSVFLGRLKVLGLEKLMGKEATAALQELQWYISSAWNAALQAAGKIVKSLCMLAYLAVKLLT